MFLPIQFSNLTGGVKALNGIHGNAAVMRILPASPSLLQLTEACQLSSEILSSQDVTVRFLFKTHRAISVGGLVSRNSDDKPQCRPFKNKISNLWVNIKLSFNRWLVQSGLVHSHSTFQSHIFLLQAAKSNLLHSAASMRFLNSGTPKIVKKLTTLAVVIASVKGVMQVN